MYQPAHEVAAFMGHLSDLESAVIHLRKQGIEVDLFAKHGRKLFCRVLNVVLTDRDIVKLHRKNKLDETGLKAFANRDDLRTYI